MPNLFTDAQVTDLESLDFMIILNEPDVAKLRIRSDIIIIRSGTYGYHMDDTRYADVTDVIAELHQMYLCELAGE